MAIITTTDEVKVLLPNLVSNLSDNGKLPNFESTDGEHLVPMVGSALYNDIEVKYKTGSLSDEEKKLLKKMQLVSAAHAYAYYMAIGHITISDTGAKKFTPKDTTPVAKWEFEKAQEALTHLAYRATENLLHYLYENNHALWQQSDFCKTMKQLLIKSGSEFNQLYRLQNPLTSFYFMVGRVLDAQRLYLMDVFGETLMSIMVGNTYPSAISTAISYVKSALAYFTFCVCAKHEHVMLSNEGFTIGNILNDTWSGGRKRATGVDIDIASTHAENMANNYLNNAKYELYKYCKDNTGSFADSYYASPLKDYIVPEDQTLGNERRKGVFRWGR